MRWNIRVHRNRRRSRSHQEHQARAALRRPDDPGENRFRGDPDRRQHCRERHLPDGDPTFSRWLFGGRDARDAEPLVPCGTHGGGGGTTYYTLRYESNGGTKYKDERYRRNTLVELDKEPVREGYTFTGWYADKALTEPIDDIRMTSNKTVYAGWEKTGVPDRLNGDDHFAYIIGRDDGLVHPEAPITRAEVATIFFRLLTDEARDEYLTETSPFADVASDAWYATAVATMQAMGIVEGRSPSAFDPEAPITRGEFAAIAARFDSDPYHGDDRFSDISGHWAAGYINQAAVKGWVEGQPDGSFAPDRSITRAEAMTTINRVLGRLPETADDLLDDMIAWPDNPPDAWYYLAVQEATNSHDYDRKADTVHETWTGLQPAGNWAQYQ